ncbi:MAG: radical SAM protein [Planctomycetota bacterium]|nr:radical SAM protein [Planctomycetota bacterium]
MQPQRTSWDDQTILAARPPKNTVDPRRPYAYLVEPECAASGRIEDVATIFLTNRECPFRCLMCDLWKNTTDERVPAGAIPEQIAFALSNLSRAKHVKLYNSGNFFDRQAIPREDYAAIAQCVAPFETVIVENHPKLCGDDCLRFRDLLAGKLEIAIGLETIHPDVLPRLNKQMTTDGFQRAVRFLSKNGIATRAFILLRPPFLDEAEGVEWAIRSIRFAFDAGVQCCSVIPTRDGNGAMEQLRTEGRFEPPTFRSLETVLTEGLAMQSGRVFVDLWDAERFFDCQRCGPARRERLARMNLTQQVLPAISCGCEAAR